MAIAQEKDKISKNNYREQAIDMFFEEPSEFSNLLVPLLEVLRWPGNYRNLVESLPHFARSLGLTDFRNIMANLRYKSEVIYIDLQYLDSKMCPFIYVPSHGPAMLVIKENDGVYEVINGLTKEPMTLYNTTMKGAAYLFRPLESDANYILTDRLLKQNWFMGSILRFKWLIVQILVVSLFLNVLTLLTPIYVMQVYDKVLRSSSIPILVNFTIGVIIALIGCGLLHNIRAKIIAYIGARLDKTVGDVILERLLYLPTAQNDSATLGSQISRLRDFDAIRDFFTSPIITILFELPFSIIFVLLIFYLGGYVILVPCVMAVLFYVLYHTLNPMITKANNESSLLIGEKRAKEMEALTEMRMIKYTGCEQAILNRYRDLSSRSTVSYFKANLLTTVINTLSDALMLLAGLGVLAYGAMLVLTNHMTLGALIAVMMLTWRSLAPFKTLFTVLPRLGTILSSIAKINRLMQIRLERPQNVIVEPVKITDGSIEFDKVSFRYQHDLPPALINVKFSVKQGQLLCIVGRNGSGKSTILKLIPKLYHAQAGTILVNNTNIEQLDAIELRHQISYLPQNACLFFGTIEQNFLFANPVGTKDEMIEACKLVGVWDEINKFEDKLKTKVGDRSGATFSVSFIQKLMIARAIFSDAPIILLDEPGPNLDEAGRTHFLEALESLKHKKTVVMVTHAIATLKRSDMILYIDQGSVVMYGKTQDVLPKIPFDYL